MTRRAEGHSGGGKEKRKEGATNKKNKGTGMANEQLEAEKRQVNRKLLAYAKPIYMLRHVHQVSLCEWYVLFIQRVLPLFLQLVSIKMLESAYRYTRAHVHSRTRVQLHSLVDFNIMYKTKLFLFFTVTVYSVYFIT